MVIGLDALKQPDLPYIRPLPVSVAGRVASVPWLWRQSAHEVRACRDSSWVDSPPGRRRRRLGHPATARQGGHPGPGSARRVPPDRGAAARLPRLSGGVAPARPGGSGVGTDTGAGRLIPPFRRGVARSWPPACRPAPVPAAGAAASPIGHPVSSPGGPPQASGSSFTGCRSRGHRASPPTCWAARKTPRRAHRLLPIPSGPPATSLARSRTPPSPYAASSGLRRGDGLALFRWLADRAGDSDTSRWI